MVNKNFSVFMMSSLLCFVFAVFGGSVCFGVSSQPAGEKLSGKKASGEKVSGKKALEEKVAGAKASGVKVGVEKSGKASQTSVVSGDKIVARVGDDVLRERDVEFLKKMFMPRVDKDRIIYLWVINTELAKEAKKEGLADQKEVKAVIDFAKNEVLATLYVRKRQENVEVSDSEARKYYEEHKEQFRSMPYVSVKYIVVKDRDEAEKIKKALVEGADFDKLVEKYKEGTLKLAGLSDVYLKDISSRDLIKPFGPPVAYTMARVDDFKRVIGPRRVPNGWILFRVLGKKKGDYVPYEKVASRLKYQLKKQKLGKIRRELISQAEKKTGVKRPDATKKRIGGGNIKKNTKKDVKKNVRKETGKNKAKSCKNGRKVGRVNNPAGNSGGGCSCCKMKGCKRK